VEAEVALATSGPVGIVFRVSRASVGGDIDVRCIVSNNTAQPIGDYTFQAAVMKVCFTFPPPYGGSSRGR